MKEYFKVVKFSDADSTKSFSYVTSRGKISNLSLEATSEELLDNSFDSLKRAVDGWIFEEAKVQLGKGILIGLGTSVIIISGVGLYRHLRKKKQLKNDESDI